MEKTYTIIENQALDKIEGIQKRINLLNEVPVNIISYDDNLELISDLNEYINIIRREANLKKSDVWK